MDPNTQQTQQAAPQQPTTTTPAAGTAPAAPAAPAATQGLPPEVAAQLAQMQAALADQTTVIASLKDEAAKRRQETKTEREAREDAARKAGDLQTVVKSVEDKLAERDAELAALKGKVAEYEPDALAQRTYKEKASQRLAEAAKALPPEDREIFDALPSVEARKKFIARVTQQKQEQKPATPATTTTPPAAPAPSGGVPGGSQPVSVLDINTASLEDLQALERADPNAFTRLTARAVNAPASDMRSRLGL